VKVTGADPELLIDACGGHVVLGAPDGTRIPLRCRTTDDGIAVLSSPGSLGEHLAGMIGGVRLWWPDGRGRAELTGTLSPGRRGSTLAVTWPPTHTQERRHLRAPATGRIEVRRLFQDGTASGRLLDLGAGGAAVVLDHVPAWWEAGVRLGVSLHLDGGPVVAVATVVRGSPGDFAAGLRFDTMSATAEDRVVAAVLAADSRRAGR
jgi:hypothetical protein